MAANDRTSVIIRPAWYGSRRPIASKSDPRISDIGVRRLVAAVGFWDALEESKNLKDVMSLFRKVAVSVPQVELRSPEEDLSVFGDTGSMKSRVFWRPP
jgi:hypothetical protein